MHVKTILGLGYKTHVTKLLQVLRIVKVSKLTQNSNELMYFQSVWFICGQTILWIFIVYIYMHICNTLAGITVKFCAENNINVTKYMLNNTYSNTVN